MKAAAVLLLLCLCTAFLWYNICSFLPNFVFYVLDLTFFYHLVLHREVVISDFVHVFTLRESSICSF